MQQTTVSLSDEEFVALQRKAAAEGQTVTQLVRRAIDRLLTEESGGDAAWREQLDRLVAQMRSRVPSGLSPQAIEDDITVARAEVRRIHHARRR